MSSNPLPGLPPPKEPPTWVAVLGAIFAVLVFLAVMFLQPIGDALGWAQ